MPAEVSVLTEEQLNALLTDLQKVPVSKDQLEEAFKAAADFRKSQDGYLKKEKKKAD